MSEHNHNHDEHEHHTTPLSVYIKVFVALIILTCLTVLTSMYDFGIMNMVIAMAIACAKAGMVVLFFMQLKFDDAANKVTFGSAFVFLAIFILFTGSDLFFRDATQPVKALAVAPDQGGGASVEEQNKLRIATPELVAKGKTLFATNCALCHGSEGKGDGPAAAALNPKPRNFTTGYWRLGGSPTRVFHTITNGSPGTPMSGFPQLAVSDRYALAHFVRSLSPNAPSDTPKDLADAGLAGGGKGATEKPHMEIPIEVAMEKLEEPDQVVMPTGDEKNPNSPGAKIYRAQCMQCHGLNGVGGSAMALGVNPATPFIVKSWIGNRGPWVLSENEFMKVVSEGIPGRGMPGQSNFSKQEWADLYAYSRSLTLP